jgi:putative alpha-1,2-mannosidase
MSAWYIFSALGFYPFDPCGGEYVLGESQFEEISVKTPGGATFRVTSERADKADKKVMLNGRKLNRVTINHQDVVSGGTLHFVK